ncbi:MAG TPA: hypothetical protein VN947_29980 [Polyangia bacterium]|nr:hypothetical protein [Polyangia bacterium]
MVPALERALSKPTTSGAVPVDGVALSRADGVARAGDDISESATSERATSERATKKMERLTDGI